MSDHYIPNARDAVIAYVGGNTSGRYRLHCCTCLTEHPLASAQRIYGGDYYVSEGPWDRASEADQCDICGVTLQSLSERCQREHDEQQARWARTAAPTMLVEYGVQAAIRCRVY